MATLADNPVFKNNPQCLADFMEALLQPSIEKLPTPSSRSIEPSEPSPSELSARKQFWSKFKRPSRSVLCDGDSSVPPTLVVPDGESNLDHELLRAPTLTLGDPVGDAPRSGGDGVPAATSPVPVVESQVGVDGVPSPALASEVVPPGATLEAVATDRMAAVRARIMKMDDREFAKAIEEAKHHPEMKMFSKVEGFKISTFGTSDDAVEELLYFYEHLDHVPLPCTDGTTTSAEGAPEDTLSPDVVVDIGDSVPPLAEQPVTAPVAEPVATPAEPVAEPVATVAEPVATPVAEPTQLTETPASETPAATPAPGDSNVAAALKRMQTVDLAGGMRPPRFLSAVAETHVPTQTVVLLESQGGLVPVALPLSIEQCVKAGLKLAADSNPPSGHVDAHPTPPGSDARPTPSGSAGAKPTGNEHSTPCDVAREPLLGSGANDSNSAAPNPPVPATED